MRARSSGRSGYPLKESLNWAHLLKPPAGSVILWRTNQLQEQHQILKPIICNPREVVFQILNLLIYNPREV
jgi:hypothetical protein